MKGEDMKGEDMKENEKELLGQLKEKLHWYTVEASDEEFDEGAVESILYLLDRLEPVEDAVPDVEEAWGQFLETAKERGLGLDADPAEACADGGSMAADCLGRGGLAVDYPGRGGLAVDCLAADGLGAACADGGGMAADCMGADRPGRAAGLDAAAVLGGAGAFSAVRRKLREGSRARGYCKCAGAAAAVVMALIVAGGVKAGASRDTGFFHWLRRDETKIQMVTSPENLDGKTDTEEVYEFFDRKEVPEWAEEWYQIDIEFGMPENYTWQNYEIHELDNLNKIASCYVDTLKNQEMLLGMVLYLDKVSFNTEELTGFEYVDKYESDQKQMSIYSKIEETGEKCYLLYFFEENCQYFMVGYDNLDELKDLIGQYWIYVKQSFEKNKKICNKVPFKVINKVEG